VKKKDSLAWRIAKTRARRKYVCSVPIALSADGHSVTMQSLIRGNTWVLSLQDLQLLTRGTK
jgi:hypothetical protein